MGGGAQDTEGSQLRMGQGEFRGGTRPRSGGRRQFYCFVTRLTVPCPSLASCHPSEQTLSILFVDCLCALLPSS